MSVIYMIRHAQASFGKANYDQLSELGVQQANILAARLNQAGLKFDAVYKGLLLRHEQTAAACIEQCEGSGKPLPPIYNNEAFNEYDSEKILTAIIPVLINENPSFENNVKKMFADGRSFQRILEKVMLRWVRDGVEVEGVGAWAEYSRRVCSAIDELMEKEGAGKDVAIFTSGGPIAVTVQKALTLSNEEALNILWQIVNTSVTRFKYSGNRLALFSFNDFSHLEDTKDKRTITYR
jgi:broad specificity phosphatase PhoE